MESTLIKSYNIPEEVSKKFAKFTALELYTDRLVGKGNTNGDITFFFKNYMDVKWYPASITNMYAQIIFITHENASNYANYQQATNVFADANRIPFCSGTFKYAPANEYVKKLCIEIKDALAKYQENAPTNGTSTVVQAALSPAEELKKYKELLDSGIITQEEFDAKKKQLLGL